MNQANNVAAMFASFSIGIVGLAAMTAGLWNYATTWVPTAIFLTILWGFVLVAGIGIIFWIQDLPKYNHTHNFVCECGESKT